MQNNDFFKQRRIGIELRKKIKEYSEKIIALFSLLLLALLILLAMILLSVDIFFPRTFLSIVCLFLMYLVSSSLKAEIKYCKSLWQEIKELESEINVET